MIILTGAIIKSVSSTAVLIKTNYTMPCEPLLDRLCVIQSNAGPPSLSDTEERGAMCLQDEADGCSLGPRSSLRDSTVNVRAVSYCSLSHE